MKTSIPLAAFSVASMSSSPTVLVSAECYPGIRFIYFKDANCTVRDATKGDTLYSADNIAKFSSCNKEPSSSSGTSEDRWKKTECNTKGYRVALYGNEECSGTPVATTGDVHWKDCVQIGDGEFTYISSAVSTIKMAISTAFMAFGAV